MKLSDYIFEFLRSEGVSHVFTVTGGMAMHLDDSLGNAKGIEYVCNHHEQACAMAAEGCQRANGKLGVALSTAGPGGTNMITGTLCAWVDCIPLLFISGQVNVKHMMGQTGVRVRGVQEADIVRLVQPITKYAVTVTDPATIRYHLQKAVFLAHNGSPGPVWLDIPLNVQAASIEPSALAVFDAKVEYPDLFSLDKTLAADVQAVAQALRNARRPLLVAGHGIRLSGAIAAFRSLVEKSGVPVVVTKNAYDVLEGSHPSMMGMAGIYGQRSANFAIQSADLIVFIGSRLALTFVGYETQLFSPGSKRMVVDIDQNQLDHENVRVDKKIRQDARRFVEALEVELKGKKVMGSEEWVERCAHWKKTYPTVTEKERTQKKFINSYYFMEFLVDSLPKDAIIVHDQGAAFFCPNQSAILKKGQRMFTNGDVSPMGYGLPAAIGACVGINRKPIYCVMGDGGLQFNIQELQTIVHYKLPIKLLVLNNEGYLSIKHTQINFFKSHFVGSNSKSGLSCPDLSKISKAYGLPYVRICTNEEMRKQLPAWLAQPGAGVMEIMMDPVQPFLPKVQSERRADGTMESKPLEDMAPYVSRETLKKEMAFSSGD